LVRVLTKQKQMLGREDTNQGKGLTTLIMQKLILFEDVFDALATGKVVTIRKGKLSIALDDLLFQSAEKKREQIVCVKEVYYGPLKEVKQEDMVNDGFNSHQEMAEKMKRFYPDITLETEVTVVRFDQIISS